jgi:hypothetical protein
MSTNFKEVLPQMVPPGQIKIGTATTSDWTVAPDNAHEYQVKPYVPPGPQKWSSSGADKTEYNRTDWVDTGWIGFGGYPIYGSLASARTSGFFFHTNLWAPQWVTTAIELNFSSSAGYNAASFGSGLVNGKPWLTWMNWDASCEMKVSWSTTNDRWECTFNQNAGGHTIGEMFDYSTSTILFPPDSGWNAGSTMDIITHYDYYYTYESTSTELPTGLWALIPEGGGATTPPTVTKL